MCGEGREKLVLLALGHLEEVERSSELSRDLIELGRRNLQLADGRS